MAKIMLLLLCALFSIIGCQISLIPDDRCGNDIGTRVTNAIGVEAEKAPWNVLIESKKKAKVHCGGSIISRTAIVTAAHCFWLNDADTKKNIRMKPEDLNIYVGVSSINDKRSPLEVKSIIVHEEWKKYTNKTEALHSGHDIAILILLTELQFNLTVKPICLQNNTIQHGEIVHVYGFGINVKEGPKSTEYATDLQEGKLKILPEANCSTIKDQLCTTSADECKITSCTDACKGDSGGGLIGLSQLGVYALVGIVSFGSEFCNGHPPQAYTNVQSHIAWFQEKLLGLSISTECVGINCLAQVAPTPKRIEPDCLGGNCPKVSTDPTPKRIEPDDYEDQTDSESYGPCTFTHDCLGEGSSCEHIADATCVCNFGRCLVRGFDIERWVQGAPQTRNKECSNHTDCPCRNETEKCFCIDEKCVNESWECHDDKECSSLAKCDGKQCTCTEGTCEWQCDTTQDCVNKNDAFFCQHLGYECKCLAGQCESVALTEECKEPGFGVEDPSLIKAGLSACVKLGKCSPDLPCQCLNNYCTKPWYANQDGDCREKTGVKDCSNTILDCIGDKCVCENSIQIDEWTRMGVCAPKPSK